MSSIKVGLFQFYISEINGYGLYINKGLNNDYFNFI